MSIVRCVGQICRHFVQVRLAVATRELFGVAVRGHFALPLSVTTAGQDGWWIKQL